MLREVVGNYLDRLSERDFDQPLLALLQSEGFFDVHLLHGAYEYGKDVIAKREDPTTGELLQYAIQAKAGDIDQQGWREVQGQLEDAAYDLAHPSFDGTLTRVVVLLTTGRLKGAAALSAQAFRDRLETRGMARFEVWDKQNLVPRLSTKPMVLLPEANRSSGILQVIASIQGQSVSERALEEYGRSWLVPDPGIALIEGSVLIDQLRAAGRLDLAFAAALHLHRAASQLGDEGGHAASHRVLLNLGEAVLNQVEPLLKDPLDLARSLRDPMALITYPVVCCRVSEIFALTGELARATADIALAERSTQALLAMMDQPGTAHPPSDEFAASAIAVVVASSQVDRAHARRFLRDLCNWILDRYDSQEGHAGLGSLLEDELTAVERLMSGWFDLPTVAYRPLSYLALAAVHLADYLEDEGLARAFLDQIQSWGINAESTVADESAARWARWGPGIFPALDPLRSQPQAPPGLSRLESLLLGSSCRSRHYPDAW